MKWVIALERTGNKSVLVTFRFLNLLLLSLFCLYGPKSVTHPIPLFCYLFLFYVISNLLLFYVPQKYMDRPYVQSGILLFDIIFLSLFLYLTQGLDGDLYLIYFLIIFISGIGTKLYQSFLIAIVGGLMYLALALKSGNLLTSDTNLLLRIPFFLTISGFVSFYAGKIRESEELKEEISRRELAEEKERQYVRDIAYLSRTALEFVTFPAERDIYKHIAERLGDIAGNSIVLVMSFDENTRLLECRSVTGLGRLADEIFKLIGRSPVGMHFAILEEENRKFRQGKLVKMERSIYELIQGKIPEQACNIIARVAGIGDIYSIGIAREGILFASASILMRGGAQLENGTTVETFINQASVALQRKHAEDSLRESEEKFRTIIESLPMGVHMYQLESDGQLRFVAANPAADRILGVDNKQYIGKTIEEAFPAIMETDIPKRYRAIAKKGGFWKKEDMVYKDELIEGIFESYNFQTSPGKMVSLFLDVTERKRMEERLHESETRYQTLFDRASIGIGMADLEGKILVANQRMQEITGYTLEEFKSVRLKDTYASPDDRKRLMDMLKESSKVRDFETKLKRKDGTVYPALLNVDIIEINNKKVLLTTCRDITDLKKAEEEKEKMQAQFLQAQKMEAIGTLAAGVAHDFNNLLTTVQGNADLAMAQVDRTGSLYNDLKEISVAAARASSLTRQLLLFSRKQPLGFTTLNINTTIEHLLKMLERLIGEDIAINTELEPALWQVNVDEGSLEQVITNLAVNARDAMPKGGKITIKTENVTINKEYSRTIPEARPGRFVYFSLADTGTGIDKETLKHIFEPFFSTKGREKGTGLGLSVIYGIVKQHEGWINVYSEPRHGAVFKIYLPASSREVKEKIPKKTISKSLKAQGERILLVEDEESIRRLAVRVLTMNGYVVFEAKDVKEALKVFNREKQNIDLVLSDVVLTDRTGLELADQLLSRKPGLQIILTSGYLDEKSQWPVIQERGFRFIQKPFEINDLLKAIRETLDQNK